MTTPVVVGLALALELVALIAVLIALRSACTDLRYVRAEGVSDARARYARERVRREVVRLGEVAVFVALTMLLLQEIDPDRALNDWLGAVLALFCLGQAGTAANSWLDLRLWRWLRQTIAQEQRDEMWRQE